MGVVLIFLAALILFGIEGALCGLIGAILVPFLGPVALFTLILLAALFQSREALIFVAIVMASGGVIWLLLWWFPPLTGQPRTPPQAGPRP